MVRPASASSNICSIRLISSKLRLVLTYAKNTMAYSATTAISSSGINRSPRFSRIMARSMVDTM